MFSDILPTGYETGVLRGRIKLGDVVAIVGAGPIGLSSLLLAQFYAPSEIIMIDPDEYRLQVAKRLGATSTINERNEKATQAIMQKTNGKGVDVAIEAVGIPETFDICQSIIAPGGHIANIGVHGKSVSLHLENLWHENITLTTALVDTFSISTLLKIFIGGKLKPGQLITHRFKFHDVLKAYEVFNDAAKQQALKVILETG